MLDAWCMAHGPGLRAQGPWLKAQGSSPRPFFLVMSLEPRALDHQPWILNEFIDWLLLNHLLHIEWYSTRCSSHEVFNVMVCWVPRFSNQKTTSITLKVYTVKIGNGRDKCKSEKQRVAALICLKQNVCSEEVPPSKVEIKFTRWKFEHYY